MRNAFNLKSAKARFVFFACLISVLAASCGSATQTPVPQTPSPTSTSTCTPTAEPTATPTDAATSTPTPVPVDYSRELLSALPAADDSCLPDKTEDDLGIYVYDLSQSRELVSINADVPFQFASAFKGPVLVYFLSQCKQYWDTTSPEWDAYFTDLEAARNIPYYASPEYKALLASHFADPANWANVEAFFDAQRFVQNGAESAIDKRYFALSKVYAMAARSNNYATSEVLQFVFERCQPVNPKTSVNDSCYSPNAVSQFNAWFEQFAGIEYQAGEARRGLFKWDTVLEKDPRGVSYEAVMVTYGQKDQCVTQTARLNCSATPGSNVWSAQDLFKFYNALYRLEDASVRRAALAMLAIDEAGPARGNLKNLARKMGAISMSKNGHAHFILGSINADAGIFYYQNRPFVVVVLGYDAQPSLSLLYGDYDPNGAPLTDISLIRDMLDKYLAAQK